MGFTFLGTVPLAGRKQAQAITGHDRRHLCMFQSWLTQHGMSGLGECAPNPNTVSRTSSSRMIVKSSSFSESSHYGPWKCLFDTDNRDGVTRSVNAQNVIRNWPCSGLLWTSWAVPGDAWSRAFPAIGTWACWPTCQLWGSSRPALGQVVTREDKLPSQVRFPDFLKESVCAAFSLGSSQTALTC